MSKQPNSVTIMADQMPSERYEGCGFIRQGGEQCFMIFTEENPQGRLYLMPDDPEAIESFVTMVVEAWPLFARYALNG